ncbi:putative dehydrogenase [Aquisalibacillus elongatus]|uniref:Putative dehydrogenase n=2 Tax=Aquisalibacillus elongatus TaxID=485577 RepID=A0A3N5C495_9BACI|nr:putative dehydrogenase [Aquisalibacillus elongatus]
MLKVGVIGVGSISELHLDSYKEHEEVTITALCDLNETRLQEKGSKYGVSQLYTSYQELLDQSDVDAVSICTWNNSHAEIAIAALLAGKHVLVEKPLSMTVDEAEAIQATANQSNKVIQVGFVRRHGDNVKLLKEFIDQNELGYLYYAKASILRRLGNPGGWFSDSKRSGGGPLIDIGVHMIDLCWYLMGKPKPVSVSGNTYHVLGNRSHINNLSFYKAADYDPSLNDVEDLTNALIRFDNGASLFVDVSFTLNAKQDEVRCQLFGDQGGAEIEPELSLVSEKHNTILNLEPQIDQLSFDFNSAFQNEINHFIQQIKGEESNMAPVEDGVEVMRMLRAVYESAESGKEVTL